MNLSVGFSSFQRMAVWNAYGRYVCGEPYWSTVERSCILAFSRILGAHFYVSFPHRFLPEYLDRGLTLFMDRVASPPATDPSFL